MLIIDPAKPPIITAPITHAVKGKETGTVPLMASPAMPPIELTKIKKPAIPAILLLSSQFNKFNTGDKNIPPPIPTIPDKKPNAVPSGTDLINTFFLSSKGFTGLTTWKNNATDERISAPLNNRKNDCWESLKVAPHKAAGTLKIVYGIAFLRDKNPLRYAMTQPIVTTTMLQSNACVLMVLKSVINKLRMAR